VPCGILEAADLVRIERRGRHIVYSPNAAVLQETAAMLPDFFHPRTRPATAARANENNPRGT
jgi:hypothetical protein